MFAVWTVSNIGMDSIDLVTDKDTYIYNIYRGVYENYFNILSLLQFV